MCKLLVCAVCAVSAGALMVARNWTMEELINTEEEQSLTTQVS